MYVLNHVRTVKNANSSKNPFKKYNGHHNPSAKFQKISNLCPEYAKIRKKCNLGKVELFASSKAKINVF